MKALRIKDWDEHFENNRTRELTVMRWLPIPNKHDGDGYSEMVDGPNGAAYYGAWVAVLQVASRCRKRGTLLRDGDIPHTATSLSRMTRLPADIIQRMLNLAVSIGWVETFDVEKPPEPLENTVEQQDTEVAHPPAEIPHPPAEQPHPPDANPQATDYGIEGNRREVQLHTHTPAADPPPRVSGLAPSLDAVVFAAEKAGCPKEEAERFWNHYEAMGWIDKNGHPILRWQNKLAVWTSDWKAKQQQQRMANGGHGQTGPPGRKPLSVYETKSVMEAKENRCAELKRRHCLEGPMDDQWNDPEKRKEYLALRKEIRELNGKLASLG